MSAEAVHGTNAAEHQQREQAARHRFAEAVRVLAFTHSTSEVQAAFCFGLPDLLMLITDKPVFTPSSHMREPTKPLPPNTSKVGNAVVAP